MSTPSVKRALPDTGDLDADVQADLAKIEKEAQEKLEAIKKSLEAELDFD